MKIKIQLESHVWLPLLIIYFTPYIWCQLDVTICWNDECHYNYREEMFIKCSKYKKYQKCLTASWNTSFLLPFLCFAVPYSVHLLIAKGNAFLHCVKYLYFCDMFGKDMKINWNDMAAIEVMMIQRDNSVFCSNFLVFQLKYYLYMHHIIYWNNKLKWKYIDFI